MLSHLVPLSHGIPLFSRTYHEGKSKRDEVAEMGEKPEPRRGALIVTGVTMLLLTMALIVFSEPGYHATVAAM